MDNMRALFIITNAGFSDEIIGLARECGARGATVLTARGIGLNVKEIMGISVDREREIVISVVDVDTAEKIMAAVKEKAGISSTAHGVCFSLPIDNMTKMH